MMKPAIKYMVTTTSILLMACQTTSAAEPQPARLVSADSQTKTAVKVMIAKTMPRKNIKFGATDWATASTISVLPLAHNPIGGPFTPQQFVRPTLYDVMMMGAECYLLERETQTKIPLGNIPCTAL